MIMAKEKDMLVPREQYLKAGAHIGMTFKTADMQRFIYKIRPNGLAVLNIGILDKHIHAAVKMLARSKKILAVSRKENGRKPVKAFAKAVGGKCIAGRFMPGSLTNPNFKDFFEPEIIVITDPAIDKQALKEAVKIRIPIIALCDTFNQTSFVDLVIPCNNKGKKSLGLIYYILAKYTLKERGQDVDAAKLKLEDFETE
ncbi:MAG: 30S ribosomal protein S2 [Candidatus Aenigmarchaeota archaeon]|nr:30S ribosomal protein S2 [Candidatus Aenigmarchaeota archaeon]OYT58288.1 MAG: 30S ribosomal protein S2 [Candidatus Aenigmarchaeota archaeon ex4484_14]